MRRLEPGTFFGVPIIDRFGTLNGCFALGVVVRHRKPMIFAYFFPPALASLPDVSDVAPLAPENAIYGTVTGDRALREGRWKLIGIPGWSNPNSWPFPPFCRRLSNGEFDCMRYSEDDLLTEIERFTCTVPQGPMCIDTGVADLGFTETRVRNRLREYSSNCR